MSADSPLPKEDLLSRLESLLKQATTERSHYYVASCVAESITEISELRLKLVEAHQLSVRQANELRRLRQMHGVIA